MFLFTLLLIALFFVLRSVLISFAVGELCFSEASTGTTCIFREFEYEEGERVKQDELEAEEEYDEVFVEEDVEEEDTDEVDADEEDCEERDDRIDGEFRSAYFTGVDGIQPDGRDLSSRLLLRDAEGCGRYEAVEGRLLLAESSCALRSGIEWPPSRARFEELEDILQDTEEGKKQRYNHEFRLVIQYCSKIQ